ncbi:hypothetical protein GCM10010341_91290 [Streptomyces noursei]|nr:hypothetical protein GCM10010341_91290 [Streptomyces noursei]
MLATGTVLFMALLTTAAINPEYRALCLYLLTAAAAFLVTGAIRVTVDQRGVTVASALLPLLRRRFPLSRIKQATARWTRATEVGGWGYRWNPGLSAISLRSGMPCGSHSPTAHNSLSPLTTPYQPLCWSTPTWRRNQKAEVMLVTIDHGSSVPLAEQIAASVRRALAEGKLRKGERLPAARTLAGTLDVNMHTVLRGYQILQQEDLIDLRRGRGAVVSGRSPGDRALVVETCRQLVGLAQGIGLEERDVLTMVSDTYRSLV